MQQKCRFGQVLCVKASLLEVQYSVAGSSLPSSTSSVTLALTTCLFCLYVHVLAVFYSYKYTMQIFPLRHHCGSNNKTKTLKPHEINSEAESELRSRICGCNWLIISINVSQVRWNWNILSDKPFHAHTRTLGDRLLNSLGARGC